MWDGYGLDGEHGGPPAEFRLVQCDTCSDVSLEVREDYGQGFEANSFSFVYPAPRRLHWHIPSGLRREWEEARACFESKAYTATAVMVRRTLEGTCRDQGVKERKTLAEGLKQLRAEGKIDGTLAEWANLLRVVGNEGAHYTGKAVSREDAEDALSFAEALLDHIYVLRQRFDDFKARRDKGEGDK